MNTQEVPKDKLSFDKLVLSKIQQKRFASLAEVDEKEVLDQSIAQLSENFKWQLDPHFFFYKKICGRVVKKDPVTGEEYPVPFATVHVEDTDCNFITYSPKGSSWVWHFPFYCRREVIGKVKTDACGNFCVWVPRFEIDYILRWRKQRICFPRLFERPRLGDILTKYPPFPKPEPQPDPSPWDLLNATDSQLKTLPLEKERILRREILQFKHNTPLGVNNSKTKNVLDSRSFDYELPAPLPSEFQKALSGDVVTNKGTSANEAIRNLIADKVGLNPKVLDGLDIQRAIGPFYRCFDYYVPEWQALIDVPDITFRVTQDTNGDGVEETIYSEGYFDVRWNAGSISNITLVASSIAKESRICNSPDRIPCDNVPALQMAGYMPLGNPSYFNNASGYTIRPNRPSSTNPPTDPRPNAETPFHGTIGLFGCVDVQKAEYYRMEQSTDGGATYSAITGLSWNNYISGATPIPIVADVNGWYPVNPTNPVNGNPISRNTLVHPHLVLVWPTPTLQKTILRIELGNGSKTHMAYSSVVAIQSDNTVPQINNVNISWKFVGENDLAFRPLLGVSCPMIRRGSVARDIEVLFTLQVSANHLRDASINTSGCGDGNFVEISDSNNHKSHWHSTVLDNTVSLSQRYTLSAASLPGCYSFSAFASSRAMNPSGADGGNLTPPDWFYEPINIYTNPSWSIAVVNEN